MTSKNPKPKIKTNKTKVHKSGDKANQPRAGISLKKTLDLDLVAKLIKDNHGNISRVADMLGTTRGAIRRLCDSTPFLKEVLSDARERQLDILEESCFDRAMKSNDTTLQLFLLKTQGKSRGYDQNEAQHTAKDIATAAFDFIVSKSQESQG